MTRCLVILVAAHWLAQPLVQAAENSLGIPILPAPPARTAVDKNPDTVQFAAWPTRVQDFERFVAATHYDATGDALSLGADGWKARGDNWRNPGFPQGPDHPVVCVSYFDALAFCGWLTRLERESGRLPPDRCYRLPSDDEWQELVDWAYDGRKYPWSEISPGLREVKDWPPAWYHGNYAGEEVLTSGTWPQGWQCATGYRDEFVGTAPVTWGGSERWGYHDLSGNIWQWTTTAYRRELNRTELREKYRFLDRDTDDTGKPSKVIRGGSWNDYFPGLLELNTRGAREPHNRNSGLGFRIVLAPGDVPND